jgi:hypothetical protein
LDRSRNTTGCAAGGDAISGEEFIEIREGEIEALSGLEALGVREELAGEVAGLLLFLDGAMMGAESGLLAGGEAAALAACGGAMGAAIGEDGGFHGH